MFFVREESSLSHERDQEFRFYRGDAFRFRNGSSSEDRVSERFNVNVCRGDFLRVVFYLTEHVSAILRRDALMLLSFARRERVRYRLALVPIYRASSVPIGVFFTGHRGQFARFA